MVKVYYCKKCDKIFYLSYFQQNCNKCNEDLVKINISYNRFTNLDKDERKEVIQKNLA